MSTYDCTNHRYARASSGRVGFCLTSHSISSLTGLKHAYVRAAELAVPEKASNCPSHAIYQVPHRPIPRRPSRDLRGVFHPEDEHHEERGRRMEDVEWHFMVEKVSIDSLDMFHHAEDESDHDEDPGEEEDAEVLSPGDVARFGKRRGVFANPSVEDECSYHEARDEENLDGKAADNDAFAESFGVDSIGASLSLEGGTNGSNQEGYHVANDEDLCDEISP